ncbi:MAG: DUF5312 domain-containing protein [Treponema sp.]|jgi:hypothetical protein|nr:DUF5312 domain-containing protein [Treponema sp.]
MSFANWLSELFSGPQGAEADKSKLLRMLLKEISHNRHRNFFKVGSGELDPAVGAFFYEIYKTVCEAGALMKNADQSPQLKQIVIEESMDAPLKAIRKRLSSEELVKRAVPLSSEELESEVEAELNAFNAAFNSKCMQRIDHYYRLVLLFTEFVKFDFFKLVKRFDPAIPEHNFEYKPRFKRVRVESLIEPLRSFLELIQPMERDTDWATVLKLARSYRNNVEVMKPNVWNSLLSHVNQVRGSNILTLIVRYVDKNPKWQPRLQTSEHRIAESYRSVLKKEVMESLNTIVKSKRSSRMTILARQVFEKAELPPRLLNYTEADHAILVKHETSGFIYAQPLNYVKTFIMDFYKTTVFKLCDFFLIKGQWSSPELSRHFSDIFQENLRLLASLQEFDEYFVKNKDIAHLKTLAAMENKKHAETVLTAINNNAGILLGEFIKAFDAVEQQFFALYNDLTTKKYEIIVNFTEMEADLSLRQGLKLVYSKLADMGQILHLANGTAKEE